MLNFNTGILFLKSLPQVQLASREEGKHFLSCTRSHTSYFYRLKCEVEIELVSDHVGTEASTDIKI